MSERPAASETDHSGAEPTGEATQWHSGSFAERSLANSTSGAETGDLSAQAFVALWQLQARYADAISSRNWPVLHELFLSDAPIHLDLVTSPPRTIVGPAELGSFVAGAIARYDHFTFVILNTVVDVVPGTDPPEATGRMFMCEVRHETATDAWTEAHGLYRDRYLHDGDRWRFAERRYRSLARRGPGGSVLGLPPDEQP